MTEISIRKPVLRIVREYAFENKPALFDIYEGEAEELMGFADSIRGDGHARVSITDNSMSTKSYGNGPGVSVTISLDCNQDDATIAQAIRGVGQWTRFFAREQFEEAKVEYQKMIDADHQVHSPPPSFKP